MTPTTSIIADPAIAAIERFTEARQVTDEIVKREPRRQAPEFSAWETEYDEAMTRRDLLKDAMMGTVPTTRAGALALISATSQAEFTDGRTIHQDDAPILLDTLAKALPSNV